jgi:hypothetical protein
VEPIGVGIAVARELRERRAKLRRDPAERAKHRLALKSELSGKVGSPAAGTPGMLEVIVRDVGRLDAYPEGDDSFRNRVSPWFRAGIVGLYDGGLENAGRAITGVVANGVAIPTEDGELLFPGGLVSYDKIVALDWDPDGHYSAPQLYCSFERGVGPYESKDTPVYRYHQDADWYERLEGVKLKKERRSPRRWWRDWRLHRKIIKGNREFDAHVRKERTRTRN